MLNILFSMILFVPQTPSQPPTDGAMKLIENERVTVWDVAWNKGKQTASRPLPYDAVSIELIARVGQPFYLKKGSTRIEGVASGTPHRTIWIDLKDAPGHMENKTSYPNAFPRPGVKKVLENDRVIVWDYTWTPGKPTPMHFHDKDVVVVYLESGDLKSTTPDGKSEVNTISFGLTRFNRRDRTHSEELVKGAARAIIVEFK